MKQENKKTFVNYIYDLRVQRTIQVPILKVMIGFYLKQISFNSINKIVLYLRKQAGCKKVNRYIEAVCQITYFNKEIKIDTFLTDFNPW